MDRTQIILLGLPILLFCSDIMNLFSPPPHKPISHKHPPIPPTSQLHGQQSMEFPIQKPTTIVPQIGVGNTVNIDFCTSCSYRKNAVANKQFLEATFPGINVVLANYPPPLIKRMLSKVIPVVQLGMIGLIVAGEQIFPKLGITTPPSWYNSLRANRFGSMASIWLLGNFVQSMLLSSGAFEISCNGKLIFSKLRENRFPSEIELKDLVGRIIANT